MLYVPWVAAVAFVLGGYMLHIGVTHLEAYLDYRRERRQKLKVDEEAFRILGGLVEVEQPAAQPDVDVPAGPGPWRLRWRTFLVSSAPRSPEQVAHAVFMAQSAVAPDEYQGIHRVLQEEPAPEAITRTLRSDWRTGEVPEVEEVFR